MFGSLAWIGSLPPGAAAIAAQGARNVYIRMDALLSDRALHS